MKKTIALLLSLIMLLSCIAAFGDEVEEEPEDKSATYQLRNATGEPLVALAVTVAALGGAVGLVLAWGRPGRSEDDASAFLDNLG